MIIQVITSSPTGRCPSTISGVKSICYNVNSYLVNVLNRYVFKLHSEHFVTLMFWLHRNNMADKIGTFHICWISCWYIHYLLLKLYTIKSPYTFNILLSPLRTNITFFFYIFQLKIYCKSNHMVKWTGHRFVVTRVVSKNSGIWGNKIHRGWYQSSHEMTQIPMWLILINIRD